MIDGDAPKYSLDTDQFENESPFDMEDRLERTINLLAEGSMEIARRVGKVMPQGNPLWVRDSLGDDPELAVMYIHRDVAAQVDGKYGKVGVLLRVSPGFPPSQAVIGIADGTDMSRVKITEYQVHPAKLEEQLAVLAEWAPLQIELARAVARRWMKLPETDAHRSERWQKALEVVRRIERSLPGASGGIQ